MANTKRIPKIFIGIPTMGTVHPILMTVILGWMADAFQSGDYDIMIYPSINVQPVDNARNAIVKTFLETDATHLFFIDSDTIPPLSALRRLLAHDKPVMSGLTPIVELDEKTGDYWRKWNCVDSTDQFMQPNTGVRICKGSGGSCIMIKREVFEKMTAPWYRFEYKSDQGKDIMVGEDIYFIVNALSKGIHTYADTSILCQHEKKCMF